MTDLEGLVAFVTGAGRGQGRAHCVRLAEAGADIIATDVCGTFSESLQYPMASESDLLETRELVLGRGRKCETYRVDVRQYEDLRRAMDDGIAHLGRLDIVVANAGVISSGAAWELSEEAWDAVLDVNLKGVWNTARAAIPWMIDAGRGGSIVIISSVAGIRGQVPFAHYVASKHGAVGLMKALSNELAKHAIRVNTMHPTGVSDTGLSIGGGVDVLAAAEPLFALSAMNTLVDYVEPREVANAVAWLVSPEARYITGLQLTVDGGNTTKP